MNLISINKTIIGNDEVNSVNARELWQFLGSKQDFSTWIKNRIEKYSFEENIDFIKLHKKMELSVTGQMGVDYILTLDMAKELAMVENNGKGREIRKYFIECEKQLNNNTQIDKNLLSFLSKEMEASINLANLFGINGNQALLSANKLMNKKYNVNLLEDMGIELIAPTKEKLFTVTEIGKMIGLNAMKTNLKLQEYGYQIKVNNQWTLTPKGEHYGEVLDVGKKHSDGTPVKQIKWYKTIIEFLQ